MTEVPFAAQNYEDSDSSESLYHNEAKRVLATKALDTVMTTQDNHIDTEEHTGQFHVTTPESRAYSPYEDYRFLVHVALNGVEARADEIGTDRDGALMTSLVSNKHVGTFEGEGGIILAEPPSEFITGISAFDVGGEITNGTRASVEDLLQPANNSDYNQVDMKFRATQPIGIMIKRASTDGHELGTARVNKGLRAYAEAHNLPVAEVLVLPDTDIPTEASYDVQAPDEGTTLLTVILPDTDERYYKVQVLRGQSYIVQEGEDSAARVMKITAYGESSQELSEEEQVRMLRALRTTAATSSDAITPDDIKTVDRDVARLRESAAKQ